ncbi:hypothetical protein MLGJGCBP_09537 [Rhodococcus sp. T7]|nr:hypothetical protein MLGJGCBP_09537 [Rhodococcus sp. T7]
MSPSGIWPNCWFLGRVGWRRRAIGTSPISCLILMGCPWWRSPPTSGICWPRGERSPRSVRMGWICCDGSGSCGPTPASRGTGRLGSKPVISADGCRSQGSSLARIGARLERPCHRNRLVVKPSRRRCVRIPKRCCARSMTFTEMRAPGRSSTRSRWTGPAAPVGRTRTTIPWSSTATSAAGGIGPKCPAGSRAASRTASSTRSSPGCRRIVTGH